MTAMVVVEDLWEEYSIAEDRSRNLKEILSRWRVVRGRKSVTALQGVSLEIGAGETVGLIGENGSGKSTLLRCIAGILTPTRGSVLVGGTVSSLIELGAGFHADLTGRENALVAAVLLGSTHKTFHEKYDAIVDFAELGAVMDQPIRSFSSGMHVRLAFSIAAHAEPSILLIDEVLAVGDEAFQRKCMRKIESLQEQGVTIVFVSHELPLVRRICRRCIHLDEGRILADGPTEEVIDSYLRTEDLREERVLKQVAD